MGDGSYGDVARRFACSSFSVAVATGATNPIDVLKVRLQVPAGALAGGGGSFVGTAASMWRLEGPGAFLKGTCAAAAARARTASCAAPHTSRARARARHSLTHSLTHSLAHARTQG